MNFLDIFIEKLGEPSDIDYLIDYIQYVQGHKVSSGVTERHHLLPRCKFDDYLHTQNNLYDMDYIAHVEAHVLLAKAYPMRCFLRTLNWMLPREDREQKEFRVLVREAQKRAWVTFKETEKYLIWREKRSLSAYEFMKGGRAKEMSNLYWSTPESRKERSEHFKRMWADPIKKEQIKHSMSLERATPEAKERLSKASRKNWDNRTEESLVELREKMLVINGDEEKRRDAGEKIKRKWQDPEFREKMGNRKPKPIGGGSDKMKEKWQDPEFREKMKTRKPRGRSKEE